MRYLFLISSTILVIISLSVVFFYYFDQKEILIPQLPTHAVPTATPMPVSLLTVEQLYDEVEITQYPQDEVVTLLVTGDVIPGRSVNYKTLTYNNFHWAFEPTAEILRNADITYVNLESPIIANCPVTNEGMIFCGDARHVQGLVYAGVDVANLANNHLGNQGEAGIRETARYLQEKGIISSGINNNPQYSVSKGVKVAFLGYDDIESQEGVSKADTAIIQQEIQTARKSADLVIVQFHWGGGVRKSTNCTTTRTWNACN